MVTERMSRLILNIMYYLFRGGNDDQNAKPAILCIKYFLYFQEKGLIKMR